MADDNCDPKKECEEDETNIVTMVDVLKAEEIMEENADAVLGSADDKNCTYSEGYLNRQALYSCLTCLPADGKDRAGVCLACSYHCHADHDLVELYTKRNFRCDCGNSLFKSSTCKLDSGKEYSNELNLYNKNFQGLYCSCDRPYPDPENIEEDDMIQCFVCEDWFHSKHLGSAVPKEDDYTEMICGPCTDSLPFLQYYLGYSVNKVSKATERDEEVNVIVNGNEKMLNPTQQEGENESAVSNTATHESAVSNTATHESAVSNTATHESAVSNTATHESTTESKTAAGSETSETKDCKLKNLKKLPRESGATFWPESFRTLFCTCATCLEMYKSSKVSFITDEEDTVAAYEARGKARKAQAGAGPSQYERGMEALSSLDRVQQMEAILSYNEMKSHLSEYLTKFAENKKVVREEDIREFFSGMQARKRQKLDIPYTCR